MKHLKLFESSEVDIQLVKDIIIEIKDEYQAITGMIHEDKEYFKIELNTNKITFKGKPHTLDYIEDTNKFILLVTNISRRLGNALDREVRILDLYDFAGSVKIFIQKKSK